MVDINKWCKESPLAAWAVFISVLVTSVYGFVQMGLDLKDRFTAPPAATAEIRTVNFQNPRLVEVYAEFVNPAGFARTFRTIGVVCSTYSGNEVIFNALNNMPRELNVLPDIQLSPINIGAGSALPVRLAFFRDQQFEMNKQCKNIAVSWVGSDDHLGKGEPVEIPKGAVVFSSVKYKAR